jgi:hypothetical protein
MPPSLVSMWMLDVFCCALGCVTLLWLLNTREAKLEATRAASALTDLSASRDALAAAKADAEATKRMLNDTIESLRGQIVATTNDRDAQAKLLAAARETIAAAVARTARLDDQLAKKQQDADALAGKLATATASLADLTQLLRKTETDRDAAAAKSTALDARLAAADAKLRTASSQGEEIAKANAKIRDLTNQLDNANANLIDLQGDKKKLADKYDKLRIDSESKFAGIALTGKRVVFLVDISGSMKLTDERTPNAGKWPTVCETIAKVMRSLPDLEAYQVITFSRQADKLFAGGFLPYRGEESIRSVGEKLKQIEPVGDTNLFSGLDLAFQLRRDGLDTIYFFSDGLPTSGPGLSIEQAKLVDVQRSELLGKHIRDTLNREWNAADARGKRVRINTIGFFYESPDVGAFLWALARENDGSFVGMSRP